MDQHPGASITLSFGLVFVFAIVLYQPDHTPLPRAGPEVTASKPEGPKPARTVPVPALTPAEPLPARVAAGPDHGERKPIVAADSRTDLAASVPAPTSVKTSSRDRALSPPAEGFTQALEGETLRDVALRVYGSPEEAENLWRLNRDLIRRKNGALPDGTLLRTP